MPSMPRLPRYRLGAWAYDVVSMEPVVYRPGRRAAIDALGLTTGARVLDVGCGTGLNFPEVLAGVGPRGRLVGVDASGAMLHQARGRIRRHGWSNTTLVQGDAAQLGTLVRGEFDAVLFTYSLSVIVDWRPAWEQAWGLLRVGGRVAVVDTALPTGAWRLLSPLARLALFTGGVDASRRVWQQVAAAADETQHHVMTGGHVHVAAGTKPARASRAST
ncbi:MAG: methyltransferase domain-containing protein [Lapillicoccus sp.]